jgi:hypothetical protein
MRIIVAFNLLITIVLFPVLLLGQKPEGTIISRNIRVIDYKEKPNTPVFAIKSHLNVILYSAITKGWKGQKIAAYSDSSLTKVISEKELMVLGGYEETVTVYADPDNELNAYDTVIFNPYKPESVNRLIIVEDSIIGLSGQVLYDIISIAPLAEKRMMGAVIEEYPLFYVKFEEIAPIIKKEPFYSYENRDGKMSFYDYFSARLFKASLINKDYTTIR